MLISPATAIENGWITGITRSHIEIQPNAIDFTLDVLFSINSDNVFMIGEDEKQMRGGFKIEPTPDRQNGPDAPKVWTLNPNSVYDGMSNFSVKLPEGVAAELIIRSTFNRNGIFLTSGLYDSGYEGPIGFAIHNRSGFAKIQEGTRIGQIKFVASDSSGLYAGGYNHEEGSHWSEK